MLVGANAAIVKPWPKKEGVRVRAVGLRGALSESQSSTAPQTRGQSAGRGGGGGGGQDTLNKKP